MTTDLIARLRKADPCPPGFAYDDWKIAGNIAAIVSSANESRTHGHIDAEPLDTPRAITPERVDIVPVKPPRQCRRWMLAGATAVLAAAAVVVPVAVSSSGDGHHHLAAGSWTRYVDRPDPLSFDHPAAWSEFHPSFQSTTVKQVVWLSSVPFPDPCYNSQAPDGSSSEGCDLPQVDLRDGGVFVVWSTGNLPTASYRMLHPTGQIGGYAAEVRHLNPSDDCMKSPGAAAEVSAEIIFPSASQPTRMTACLGQGAVQADVDAVDRMLASVRFGA